MQIKFANRIEVFCTRWSFIIFMRGRNGVFMCHASIAHAHFLPVSGRGQLRALDATNDRRTANDQSKVAVKCPTLFNFRHIEQLAQPVQADPSLRHYPCYLVPVRLLQSSLHAPESFCKSLRVIPPPRRVTPPSMIGATDQGPAAIAPTLPRAP
jgi:hypothetical protein